MKLQHGRRIRSRNKKGVAIELLQTATPVFPPEHKAISTGRIELRKKLDFFERTAASGTLLRRVRFSTRVNTDNFESSSIQQPMRAKVSIDKLY